MSQITVSRVLLVILLSSVLMVPLNLHLVAHGQPSAIFSDGFESGDFSAWTGTNQNGGTISVTSGDAYSGNYKATAANLLNWADYAYVSKALPSTYKDLYASAYVRIDSKPSTSQWYDMGVDIDGTYGGGNGLGLVGKAIFNPNTNKWGIRAYTEGSYVTYNESGTSTVNAGVYYCVELRTYVDSNGFITLWVDGSLKLNQTWFDTTEHGLAAYAFAGYRWVEASFSSPLTENVDSYVVSTSYIGEDPYTYSGTIYVNANGTVTPSAAPLSISGDTYTFTQNITASGIVVNRSGTVLEGNQYTLQAYTPSGNVGIRGLKGSVTIQDVHVVNFGNGIGLNSVFGNTISGNTIKDCLDDGIDLFYSGSNTITGNTITNNGLYGIEVFGSGANTISSNKVTGNADAGVMINGATSNTVSHNNVTGGAFGVFVNYAPYNTVSYNNLTGSTNYGIDVYSSHNCSIIGNTLKNNYEGIYETQSFSNTISHNYFTGNTHCGIFATVCSEDTLSYNDFTNNFYGIAFARSNSSIITRNNITSSHYRGISLGQYAESNTLTDNTIRSSSYGGLYITMSSGNSIYHNNFIDNTPQASTNGSSNTWDNGYPSGGNYWSDYLTRYPSAAEIGSSGIWNAPYVLNSTNTDNYPLNEPRNLPAVIPLSGWTVDSQYTNASNVLSSSQSSLYLQLNTINASSRVTIHDFNIPKLNMSNYAYISVTVTGSSNARILFRFFLNDGTGFDVVYWSDPVTLDSATFYLSPYAGRTLNQVYVAVMSSDGKAANITITQISFVMETVSPVIPLSGWTEEPTYTNSPYVLHSGPTSLYLQLNATNTSSRVTVSNLNIPKLNLSSYTYMNATVSGSSNARILLRFFLNDGTGFDVIYWGSPAALSATKFDLTAYAGRTLSQVYIALMSSDGTKANVTITQIALSTQAIQPLIPLAGWEEDPAYTNAPYVLGSSASSLHLQLNAADTSSRVTIHNFNIPKLKLSSYTYLSVLVSGTSNARILLRFFLDDGSGFDVAYWESSTILNVTKFDLSPYKGRTLDQAYVALMSSDGTMASITFTQIAFSTQALPSTIPLAGWQEDPQYTNSTYALNSGASSLYLQLNAVNMSSRVTIYNFDIPKLNMSSYASVNVTVTGTTNARILVRFFLDNGTGFDIVRYHNGIHPIWESPANLTNIVFDLSPYAGRTISQVYIALMSSDGTTANFTITRIAFTHR